MSLYNIWCSNHRLCCMLSRWRILEYPCVLAGCVSARLNLTFLHVILEAAHKPSMTMSMLVWHAIAATLVQV
jgi:hypothetical protein